MTKQKSKSAQVSRPTTRRIDRPRINISSRAVTAPECCRCDGTVSAKFWIRDCANSTGIALFPTAFVKTPIPAVIFTLPLAGSATGDIVVTDDAYIPTQSVPVSGTAHRCVRRSVFRRRSL